jgi:uncharacterized repeat protein (TIGR01451 family)
MDGIGGVAVVLQDVASSVRLSVITDANGHFMFDGVPDGEYRLTEAYGTAGVPSPGDWSSAEVGEVPHGVTPPIGYAPNPPDGATDLDCTTPNTLFFSVTGNMNNLYLCNAPVKYIPICTRIDRCATIDPYNLLTDADSGTMGTFPAGTPANTGVPVEPYPDNVPDFTYVLPQTTPGHAPEAEEYTVQNIMNDDNSNTIGAWWRIADHTAGNETGRMMVVNGDEPGTAFFKESVTVKENTYYFFSVWILNLMKAHGWADPALGVKILDDSGKVIYSETLGAKIPVNTAVPEWRQVGSVIYSGENTELTVLFISEGPEEIGNDYVIDDIALQQIRLPIFTPRKSCDKWFAAVGDTATYTVILENTCTYPLTQVTFRDTVPQGLEFVPDSVTINGSAAAGLNPEVGFAVPDIAGGSEAVITFDVTAVFVPDPNPTINRAEMSYEYTPIDDSNPRHFEVVTNDVPLRINPGWCKIEPLGLQREQRQQISVPPEDSMKFDTPLTQFGDIEYRSDGSVDILRKGTFVVTWFTAAMGGLARDGQCCELRRFNYDTSLWGDYAVGGNHIKVAATAGFAVLRVTDDEIDDHGKATVALFNFADADSKPTLFKPNSGIMVYGVDFECVDRRFEAAGNNLHDLSERLKAVEDFVRYSDSVRVWSQTPELSGAGVQVTQVGGRLIFRGLGQLNADSVLPANADCYLIRSEQYTPLSRCQSDATIGTLWLEFPDGSSQKRPLWFSDAGIFLTVSGTPLTLPAGTRLSFSQMLIVVDK